MVCSVCAFHCGDGVWCACISLVMVCCVLAFHCGDGVCINEAIICM